MRLSSMEKNFGDRLREEKRVEGRDKYKTIAIHFKLLKHIISCYHYSLMNHKQIEGEGEGQFKTDAKYRTKVWYVNRLHKRLCTHFTDNWLTHITRVSRINYSFKLQIHTSIHVHEYMLCYKYVHAYIFTCKNICIKVPSYWQKSWQEVIYGSLNKTNH